MAEYSVIKLVIPAGAATPAPPLGPALGQKGLKIPVVCKELNDLTAPLKGNKVRVKILVSKDKEYKIHILGIPTTDLIKKELGIEKGSQTPGRAIVKTATLEQVRNIARKKMENEGLTARNEEKAMNIIIGILRSMGIKVNMKSLDTQSAELLG